MKIERFEDIECWKLGRELTARVYGVTREGEFRSDYGLRDQIQRAAGSVMHNVAEGFDGGSNAEFAKFLRYAQRSCTEVQSQLYVALDQSYIPQEQFAELYELARRTRATIGAFIKYLLNYEAARRHRHLSTKNQEPRTQNQEPPTKNP